MALRLVRADEPRRPSIDLLKSWRNYMTAAGMSEATIKVRHDSVRQLMRHADVDDPLDLDRQHVIDWLARPTKQWTRVTYHRSVDSFSGWLREFGHDPASNLVGGMPAPKKPNPVARPIDDETVERLLALKLGPRPYAYVRLALFQALRVHEIAKPKAEDFDFEAGWMLVKGKGAVTKPIPIHNEVAKLADRMPAMGHWFPSYSSETKQPHVATNSVSITIRHALRMAGSDATAHMLRDTCATRMQRTWKDIRVTQSMLRHNSIQSSMKYTEASNEDLQAAMAGLDWGHAVPAPVAAPALPDLASLTPDQMRALAAQLVTALAAY
jgi:integrase/recombinase XerD